MVHAEGLGYRGAATWSQDRPDGLDLVFGRDEPPPARAHAPYRGAPLANSPQIGRMRSSNLPFDGGDVAVAAFEVRPVPVESGTAKFDLNLMVQETEAGLTGYLEYSADLFARGTAEAKVRDYERLLREIAADPEADLAGLRTRADRTRSEGGVR
ncbi:condensation domain-containing protein [Streptomyces milbemycinicus]|uniref:condensation domain-containing protein n=1 Tax=Streptomyces milbemycinicus TaxID=476552 RepID=UPI0033E872FC